MVEWLSQRLVSMALENPVNPIRRARCMLLADFYQSCLYVFVLGDSDAMLCHPCYDVGFLCAIVGPQSS